MQKLKRINVEVLEALDKEFNGTTVTELNARLKHLLGLEQKEIDLWPRLALFKKWIAYDMTLGEKRSFNYGRRGIEYFIHNMSRQGKICGKKFKVTEYKAERRALVERTE